MASWLEIERIRKDMDAARALMKRLLALEPGSLTDWETDYLEDLLRDSDREELSTRQAEKLVEIRDNVELVSRHQGLSVSGLIRACHEARLDLDEEDEAWIVALHASSPGAIRRRFLWRLKRCARRLHLIEDGLAA